MLGSRAHEDAPRGRGEAPHATVLVLTYNRLPALQRCIDKIITGARLPYELIVVNNASTDGTRDWLDSLDYSFLRVFHHEQNLFVCGRNTGIAFATGEFIIQVDDDVLVAPGFDEVLLAPYENAQVGATGQEGFYQDSTWGLLIDDRRRPRPGQFCDLVMGYSWSWRNLRSSDRAVRVDGLAAIDLPGSPRFLYDWEFNPFWHEESDLQLQIRAAGYRIMVTPEVATHRSLHDWAETKADGPITGETIAARNFYKLVDKWSGKDVPFEGPRVGLAGPAPGQMVPRP